MVRHTTLDDTELETAIMRVLYETRMHAFDDLGAIDVAKIAGQLNEPAQRIAVICRELRKLGKLVRDQHVMGRYRLSDQAFQTYGPVGQPA